MSKKILIVEDDRDLQTLLKKRLISHGFDCSSAFTVEEALKALEVKKPNLIILDLGFPGASGMAFLTTARKWLSKSSDIPPVIVMSGNRDKEVIDLTLEQGAKGFVSKPVDTERLVSMIHQYIH